MTTAVLRKELAALWVSPVPYVAAAAFQAALGLLFVDQLQGRDQAVFQPIVPIAGFLLLLTVPVLTMRTVAEERRQGTLDLLSAVPVPTAPLVVGKWLAAWLTTLVVLAPAGLLAGLLLAWGDPDTGPILTGLVGLSLLAGALAGLGVLSSSLTRSQAIAALVSALGVLVLWFAHSAPTAQPGGLLARISLSERLRTFAAGAIDGGDTAFFIAVTVGSLVVAAVVLAAGSRR